jgi:hypothetical protein
VHYSSGVGGDQLILLIAQTCESKKRATVKRRLTEGMYNTALHMKNLLSFWQLGAVVQIRGKK